MGKIVLLDELTINQIAAGEVIERPASVVKELVENSIDAGATSVTVEVQNGGIKKIRIIDNGLGIAKDDLRFAFERHATSKIRVADDLENVKSMGFRGEALASIAAISNIELITKTKEEDIGNRIVVEGGEIVEETEFGAKLGTTITVSNLFYNTPVRYKFLKKDYTELGYIEDVVTRIALANPEVSIKLKNENKTIIQTSGNGDMKTVIYGLYGKDVFDGLIDVNYEYEDIKVTGVIGKPEIARSNRSYQMFFINKRYIKDKTLTSGAEQAFKGLLPIGKFGFLILNLEIEPRKIDVNVHPTKLEIRFQEEQKVFKAVYHTIREGLLKADLIKNVNAENNIKATFNNTIEEKNKTEDSVQYKSETNNFISTQKEAENPEHKSTGLFSIFRKNEGDKPIIEQNDNLLANIMESRRIEEVPDISKNNEHIDKKQEIEKDIKEENRTALEPEIKKEEDKTVSYEFNEMYSKTFGTKIKEEKKNDVPKIENISLFEGKETYDVTPKYKYCGTVFSTYIIVEIDKEMYIIDQHAAHERIMYEKVKANFYNNTEKDSQILLLPDIINLTHKEMAIVKENLDLFNKAGFMIEEFGDNTVRLIGVPAMCVEMDTKELFVQILDEINTVAITATQEKEEKFIATIACKAAVKANMKLSIEEIDNLMSKLLKLPNPFTCPHGRPTAIRMTKEDIERKFNRR